MKWSVKKGDVEHNHAVELEQADVVATGDNSPVQTEEQSALLELKVSIHRLLLDKINLGALEKLPRAAIRAEIAEIIGEMLAERRENLNRTEREALVDDVLDELLGLGPLEPLLQDPGPVVLWGTPLAKLVMNLAGALMLGSLVLGALWLVA